MIINHENPYPGTRGRGGSTVQDENNYVEPPRSTGNQTQTDYAQSIQVKQARKAGRNAAFLEGRFNQ